MSTIATRLEQIIAELQAVVKDLRPPAAEITLPKIKQRPAQDPDLLMKNTRGFTLLHCLNNMLKKWAEGDPAWPINIGLARQAAAFNLSIDALHDLIHSKRSLSRKFAAFDCGHREWVSTNGDF